MGAGLRRQKRSRLFFDGQRPLREQELRIVQQFHSVFARSFSPGMAASNCARRSGVKAREPRLCIGQMRDQSLNRAEKLRIAGGTHILAVEVFELLEIETRRRAANPVEVEIPDHFLCGKELWSPWLQPRRTR